MIFVLKLPVPVFKGHLYTIRHCIHIKQCNQALVPYKFFSPFCPIASLRLSGIGSGGLGKWNRREGCCENICLVGHHCGQLGWKLPGSSREQFEYTSDGEHLSPGPWPVGKGLLREGINALTCPDCTCVSTRSILAGVPVYVGAIYCSFPSSWISPSPLHSQFTVILHHREKEHLKFRVIHFVLL